MEQVQMKYWAMDIEKVNVFNIFKWRSCGIFKKVGSKDYIFCWSLVHGDVVVNNEQSLKTTLAFELSWGAVASFWTYSLLIWHTIQG